MREVLLLVATCAIACARPTSMVQTPVANTSPHHEVVREASTAAAAPSAIEPGPIAHDPHGIRVVIEGVTFDPAADSFEARVHEMMRAHPDVNVTIYAEPNVTYGEVVHTMDRLMTVNAKNITFGTTPAP